MNNKILTMKHKYNNKIGKLDLLILKFQKCIE